MSNTKLKVLCLSFRTPPVVRPQAILIGKMVPEWVRQGVKPVIVTYEGAEKWDIDLPIYQIPKFYINKFLNRIPPLRMILRRWYYKKIVDIVEQIIKKHNINLIFSFSNPQESNILGARLKEKLGIKFIAYFSDPWSDCPFEIFLSPWSKKRMLNQEKFVVAESDRIVFCNQQTSDLVMKKYPKGWSLKAEVVPHCYNLKDYPAVEKKVGQRFIFSYIGVFYKLRNPEIFFKVLHHLLDCEPSLGGKFKVELIGAVDNYTGYSKEKVSQIINSYGLKDNVEIIPPVSYEESLKCMKLSDCLVVIDADVPNSPFLPSKVVDYAGSGNTILGITPGGSPTAQFIKNLGCKSFNYNQIDELAEYLGKLISGEIKIEINKEYLEQYDVRNTTAKLINQFKEVLNK